MELRQKKHITLRNTPEHPLTELEIVEAAIAFANGTRLRIEGQGGADAGVGPDTIGSLSGGPRDKGAKEQQEIIRHRLRLTITDPGAAAAQYLQRDGYWTTAYRPAWTARRIRNGVELGLYQQFESVFALVDLGTLLLLDPRRKFGKQLCVCGWAVCGRFFFAKQPPRGRPQRKYCRPGHMERAHNKAAAARMQKARRAPARSHK